MRNLKFPEIEKKVQQRIYGAWGSSNSNDPNGGYIDLNEVIIGGGGSGGGGGIDYYIPLDEVTVGGGGSGGGSGSSGGWDYGDNGSYDNGGYWGDTGGSGGTSSELYGQIPNLPTSIEQQLGPMGACVSYAMSFMSGVLGHSITGANMAIRNAQTLHISAETTTFSGLTPSESATAIQSYFYTTELINITQIINAIEIGNHGVLANLYVYDTQNNLIPNIGHEVALVGYDATTELFTAADSNTGAYETYTASQINIGAGIYQINGVKP